MIAQGLPVGFDLCSVINGYDNPHDGWESFQVREYLSDELTRFVSDLSNWSSFITFTFRDPKEPDIAWSLYKWVVRQLNIHTYGKNYSRKVGHSYFSYVVGSERQKRDVLHFHALFDQPFDYTYLHTIWGDRCGFAWVDGNLRDREKVVNYVCKYVLKAGEVDMYKQKLTIRPPDKRPVWWKQSAVNEVVQLELCKM